jgi:two-component system response regulator HydG
LFLIQFRASVVAQSKHILSKNPFGILIIDDDDAVLTSARLLLKQYYQLVHTLQSTDQLAEVLSNMQIDLVLLDMNFTIGEDSGAEGISTIKAIHAIAPDLPIIALTAYGDLELAVDTMKLGVSDFITKPWQNQRLVTTIENVLGYRKTEEELYALKEKTRSLVSINETETHLPLGKSQIFTKALDLAVKVANTPAEVLLLGENGTGKGLFAKYIHAISDRNQQPFIAIDLGAISPSLIESELFGHVKGAFTDAKYDRMGKLEAAQKGTLFLDEIGNLPVNLQVKLLSVLQHREVTRVGANQPIPLDVRIISATNSDIRQLIDKALFRQDLMFRLNTIEIKLPGLKERASDIPLLATHFLQEYAKKYNKEKLRFSNQALKALLNHAWPGNIRELSHAIERSVIMSSQSEIASTDLALPTDDKSTEALNLQKMEKTMILKALDKHKGNITHAAKALGIDRLALYRRLEKHGL